MFNSKSFLDASIFLSVMGLIESPPPTVAIGIVPTGLAMLSPTVSNGTVGIIVLSR